MKQTAVEWLIEQTRNPEWHSLKRGDIIEQAKAMEKEQKGYSEEEVENIFRKYRINFSIHKNIQISAKEFNEWFKQLKNK